MNGEKIIDQLEFANAHPSGKTPFKRPEYIKKMKPLFMDMVDTKEETRFLNLVEKLAKLKTEEIKQLNISCDKNKINFEKNSIKGIF